jgi:hypothetical protein
MTCKRYPSSSSTDEHSLCDAVTRQRARLEARLVELNAMLADTLDARTGAVPTSIVADYEERRISGTLQPHELAELNSYLASWLDAAIIAPAGNRGVRFNPERIGLVWRKALSAAREPVTSCPATEPDTAGANKHEDVRELATGPNIEEVELTVRVGGHALDDVPPFTVRRSMKPQEGRPFFRRGIEAPY